VAWSPDGRTLLTGSRDRTAALWDAATGERIRVLEGHDGGVTSVAFSPDGKRALSGSQDKTVALWDAATGELLRRMKGHALWVTGVAFSSDGRYALSGSLDRTAILWDTTDGSLAATFEGHGDRLEAVAFSPDGKEALTASADRTVFLWDVEKRMRLERFIADDAVTCAAFTASGRQILAGAWNGLIYRWDRAGKEDARTFKGHVGCVLGVASSPDGLFYASSGRDGSAIIGDAVTGQRSRRLFGPECQARALAWSPGGRRLATAAEDGTVIVWEPWRPSASAREEWSRAWNSLAPEARRDAVKIRLKSLKDADASTLAEAREWLLQAGEEIVGPMMELFSPAALGAEPSEEQKKKILADLDSDTFSVRAEARKDLVAFGRGAIPWIEAQLRSGSGLSAEVRGSLGDVRQILKSAKASNEADDGRGRAVRILLELRRNHEVQGALKKYAEGPEESPATRAAKPAVGP